jgi:FG-GAP-like repeat/Calx-beta domain
MANVGDIVFIGYNGLSTAESFAFVVKNTLVANDVIKFTDDGITSAAGNALRSGEFAIQWDVPASGVPAGTVVVITNWRPATVAVPVGSTISFNGPGGTTSVTDPNIVGTLTLSVEAQTNGGLSNSGDQIFAYTGTISAATVLAGLTASAAPITTGATTTQNTYAPLPGVPFTVLGVTNAKTNFVNNPGSQSIADLTNPANFTTSLGAANVTFTDIVPGSIVSTPTVNLGISTSTGTEAGTTIVTVTATASSAVVGNQTVNLAVAGTGITAGDYNLSANQITIANGATTGSVTFTVVDDMLAEALETAALTISNPTSGITLGSTVAQNIDITDNDVATLGLTVSQGSFSEGAGTNASVGTLTRNTDTSNTLTVSLSVNDTTEASVPTSVSFGVGQSSVNFSIAAVDDSIVDGSQAVVLTAAATGFTSVTNNLTVTDNDVATLGLTVAQGSFSEGAGANASAGTLTRNTDTSNTLTVSLSVNDTTEASVPTSVSFGVGQSSVSFNIDAVDDAIVDGSQAVVLTAAATGFTSVTNNLTVTDNDVATLGLTVSQSSFSEGAGANASVATLTRNTDTSNTLTVSLSVDDTTEASVPSSVSFGVGQSSVSFNIAAVDDAIVDGSQAVVLTAAATGFTSVTNNLTVTDNDVATLGLTVSQSSFSEGAGANASVATLTRNTDTSNTLTVSLSVNDATEASVPSSVSFGVGQSSVSFNIAAVDDAIVDGSQAVVLTAAATGFTSVTNNLTVTDNDVATLGLTVSQSSFSEGAGANASVATLTRNTDTSNTLTVSLSVDDATEASVPSSVTFLAGSNTVSFNIAAVDDNVFDGSQNVVLTASKSGFTSGTANLTVTDNEVPTLSISVVGNNFSEAAGNGAAIGTVTRTGSAFALSTPLQVNVTSNDLSEVTVGNSLVPNPNIVTIAAGQASANFAVNAVNDAIVDGSQAVVLTAAATGFANSTANLTVTDNDLGLSLTDIIFSEGAGYGASYATLTRGDTSQTLTVSLSIDDTTEASVTPSSVVFAIGESSVNFYVGAINDSIVDGSQAVVLTAAATGFANSTVNLTVLDNDSVRNDFNGDGKSDILWRNINGAIAAYQMNGFNVTDLNLGSSSSNEVISGTGDFNGDGKSDILYRNTATDAVYFRTANDFNTINSENSLASNFSIVGTGDFNGDGFADILSRDTGNGNVYVDLSNSIQGKALVRQVSTTWKVEGTGDFDGDGKSDILWRNSTSGDVDIYLMDGATVSGEANNGLVRQVTNDWVIEGVDDLDGNGKSDILWRNNNSGEVYGYLMNGITIANEGTIGGVPYTSNDHRQGWEISGTGDYNGDSKADVLWRNTTNGTAYSWQLNGLSLLGEGQIRVVDNSWQVVAPTI